MAMNIVTFNIHHGRGIDGKVNLERIAQVLEDSKADVIALNEVDKHFSRRSGYLDQLAWLSGRLRMRYSFFGATISSADGSVLRQYGNAVLSRFPIVSRQNHVFGASPFHAEKRAVLEVSVDVRGHLVKMYVTHLSLVPYIRSKQVDFLTEKIKEDAHPVILTGDLNTRPGTKSWRKLQQILTDACHYPGMTPCRTFPSRRPLFRMDYIFVSRHFRIVSTEVIASLPAASDHLPLKATVSLTGKLSP
ncbi:endonuclease/exonuclease/phosphatase family protein [Paenibacillus dendritiformis]|uniref:endonuclease/exonuclease/phosphatase family protein n=1 Tax=Paenibacillus dendritiformis TaxID=130049 RepID=UPI0018CE7F99|nr:endonuclease/exonuclease/phosphatase family protein [Paenibacillus dendritiformis]